MAIESSQRADELKLFYEALINGINKDILEKGFYQGEFTSDDIKRLIEIALLKILQDEKAQGYGVKATVSQAGVEIENGALEFRGKLGLTAPLKINFETNFTLRNSPSEPQSVPAQQLKLDKPSNSRGWIIFIDQDDPDSAYALGDLALLLGITLDSINAQARASLGNPSQLIFKTISSLVCEKIQLDPQSTNLYITPQNTVQLKLAGH